MIMFLKLPCVLLLVVGCCMLFGGAYYKTQTFNAVGNRACSSLLFLAVIGIVIPTAAYQLVHDDAHKGDENWILDISRICAVVLLIM
jgi:Ca2+:H+ antiporter